MARAVSRFSTYCATAIPFARRSPCGVVRDGFVRRGRGRGVARSPEASADLSMFPGLQRPG